MRLDSRKAAQPKSTTQLREGGNRFGHRGREQSADPQSPDAWYERANNRDDSGDAEGQAHRRTHAAHLTRAGAHAAMADNPGRRAHGRARNLIADRNAIEKDGLTMTTAGRGNAPQPLSGRLSDGDIPRHPLVSPGRRCDVAEERSVCLWRCADVPVEGRSNGGRGAEPG